MSQAAKTSPAGPAVPSLRDLFPKGAHGHSKWLGMQMDELGEDWAQMRIPPDPRFSMQGRGGVFAGGPLPTLVDSACATAVLVKLSALRPMATLDMRIDFVRPARPGRPLVARGHCYELSGSLALVRCTVHDGDPADLVAQAMASFYLSAG